MHGVLSLLDEEHIEAVKDLWVELQRDFGVSSLVEKVPYPHFSYQIASDYDEQQLVSRVREIAQQTKPFYVSTGGLSLFTGQHPVLFVPIVRTTELSQFHKHVCQQISPTGTNISPYYETENWVPHITLAEHDLNEENLAQIVSRFYERELVWKIRINNLAVVWDTGVQQELRYRFEFE